MKQNASTKQLETSAKKNQSVINFMNGKESEIMKLTIICKKKVDKHK